MKAAIVESYYHPPRFRDFDLPVPHKNEVLVKVSAAALSQLVRIQSAGKHYIRPQPPFIPGVDGVGQLEDGSRVYFAFPRAPFGAMAEYVCVDANHIVRLPADIDDITAAAIANPGMSSWAALTERVGFQHGESVLINGATGASGRLAVQIAKYLGASRVVATGRNLKHKEEILALGADQYLLTEGAEADFHKQLAQEFDDGIDVVLDYLWGKPAETVIKATAGTVKRLKQPRVRFVNLGSLAGTEINLSAGALRSTGLELVGAGLGSLTNTALIRAIGQLMTAVTPNNLHIDTIAYPLSSVESEWNGKTAARIVFQI